MDGMWIRLVNMKEAVGMTLLVKNGSSYVVVYS
jgi:hypothetical protein